MSTNIAPDVADIRAEDNALRVLRGFESANRTDRPKSVPTDSFVRGEWVKMTNDGKVAKLTATVNAHASVVFRGTEGYDSYATGAVTLFENPSNLVVRTNNYVADTYNTGDILVGKLVGGKGVLAKAADANERVFAVARVHVVNDSYLDLHLL